MLRVIQHVCVCTIVCGTNVELQKTVSLTFYFVTDTCLHWLVFRQSEIVHPAFLWLQVAGEIVLRCYKSVQHSKPRSISCGSGEPAGVGEAHGRDRPHPPHPRLHVLHLPLWLPLLPLSCSCERRTAAVKERRAGHLWRVARLSSPATPAPDYKPATASTLLSLPVQANEPACPTPLWNKLPRSRWPQLPRRSPM